MARILIVGCGCRGQALAGALIGAGHAVRGTTREREKIGAIEVVGAEPFLGDPDRVATLMPALAGVTVVCWLMGTASGGELEALHATRLEMALERVIDTGVRGFVYEANGSIAAELLSSGAALVEHRCSYSRIPFKLLKSDPSDHEKWLEEAILAVENLIST